MYNKVRGFFLVHHGIVGNVDIEEGAKVFQYLSYQTKNTEILYALQTYDTQIKGGGCGQKTGHILLRLFPVKSVNIKDLIGVI